MNERGRTTDSGARPDSYAPAPNAYYFPPASYGAAPPPYPPIPQGYQHPGYYPPAPGMPYPAPYHHHAPPPPGHLDDALAEIAARMRALDGDPPATKPFVPSSPPPSAAPLNYGYPSDPYAPPHARQQAYAPPLAPSHPAEPQRYASSDLTGLESQIRQLTAQIETLRQPPAPDFSGVLNELRHDLADISARLMEAMPRRAIEALEIEVRRLAERIDISRAAGVDPDAIAGMERSLNDVRDAIRSLKPAESLAGFEQAIRNLSDRIDQSAGAYQDPASLQQLESSIVALRGIVANVASNDTLAGLAEEVRGLSARVDRVASSSKALDPDMLHSLEQRIASLPVLGAIERGFSDLKARLDSLQISPPQAVIDPTPAVDHLKRDLVRTQDSLEAVHSTLGHLVDRLAMIEGGIREARFAAEAPMLAPMPMPAAKPQSSFVMPRAEAPAAELAAPLVPDAAIAPKPAPQLSDERPVPVDESFPKPPLADSTPAPLDLSQLTVPVAVETQQAKSASSAARERSPIDPHLPPDFPLEPGSGTPHARPLSSAAERIAASEAALGVAKPGGANHPGQTNFIAAARRAAQAAASASPEIAPAKSGDTFDKPNKSIGQKVRSLFVGAGAIILIAASARVAIDMLDVGNQSVAEITAPATFDTADTQDETLEPETRAPAPALVAPSTLPTKPDIFAVPPSGVIMPERPKIATQPPARQTQAEPTGSIASRSVTAPETTPAREPAPAREAIPARDPSLVLPEKLPGALRTAAAKGQPAAEYEVGIRQIEGRGVPQNTEAGLRWLERAAQAGLAPAHFRLGGLYEKGIGVKKNLTVARRHYLAAADKGNAKAMHNLAVLFAEGIEGKPDYTAAAGWFRRAAEYGLADSQYNLAILYARGIGVEQNLAESYKWLALAAVQGDNDAAKKRDEIGAKVDPASLAAARSAVQRFTAQPQPDDAVNVTAPAGGWDRPAAETAPAKKPRAGSVVRVTAS